MYARVGKIVATAGNGTALADVLVAGTRDMPGNIHYLVSLDAENHDHIWVYEMWQDEAAHQASLQLPAVQAAIAKGRPMIQDFEIARGLTPVGG